MMGIHPHFPCGFFKTQKYFHAGSYTTLKFCSSSSNTPGKELLWECLEGYPAGTQNGTQFIHNPAGASNNFKPQRHAEAGARLFMIIQAMDHKMPPPDDS